MNLLLVEDEVALARSLKSGFESEGFSVETFHNGAEALAAVVANPHAYDTLLLDLALPGQNGDEVCSRIREKGIALPVLVLSAREQIEQKLDLFKRGADDYVTKPFSFEELLARVRALARRPRQMAPTILVAGEVSLNEAKREARCAGEIVPLTATEFDLLAFLIRHSGRVVTREEFSQKGLCADGRESNALNVHMKNIRSKLGEGYGRDIIRTVHGVGYTVA